MQTVHDVVLVADGGIALWLQSTVRPSDRAISYFLGAGNGERKIIGPSCRWRRTV
jgi:hypothetical protein